MELSSFVSSQTLDFFETLSGVRWHSFLTEDPKTWHNNSEFKNLENIVNKLIVVNDPAERGISLITKFNNILTHQEDQKQFLLQVIEAHYKIFPNSKKAHC